MNEHQLSNRLQRVAELIPNGSRLADIGSDHAYLPVHLLLQGKICMAIAGEINDGPFRSAQKKVKKLGLESVVEVRKGDGLDVLKEGEVDVISMAGMGGALIVDILNKGLSKLHKVQRLILQPNVASHLIRRWFIKHHWQLQDERIIKEEGQFYEVLMAEPGDPYQPYQSFSDLENEMAITMGPFLLQERSKAFVQKWQKEINKMEKIMANLQYTHGEEKDHRMRVMAEEIKRAKEAIQQ